MSMSFSTAGGGITWDRWVSIYTKATLYNYAVSGAFCDNSYAKRYVLPDKPYPDVIGVEIPTFLGDTKYVNRSTGTNTVYTDRRADNTVYALWIGTNDLGGGAFLDDSNFAGTTITNYTDCIFRAFDAMYEAGGRHFVLMNLAPLELSPLVGINGTPPNNYWENKPSNITMVGYKTLEYTTLANQIFSFQVPYELLIKRRYPGAAFAIYDVNGLIRDIYIHPQLYLNGSSPVNVTGYYHHCDSNGENCYNLQGDADSFLWYDELHPTERVDQIIAENFADVVKGHSKYATYW